MLELYPMLSCADLGFSRKEKSRRRRRTSSSSFFQIILTYTHVHKYLLTLTYLSYVIEIR